ncbi:hypothetical protein LCGC14_2644390, partial [marine sediment metagenome]
TGKGSIGMNYLNLTCDLCDSNDIVETIQGYVCRTCSVELTIQKLRYDRPYSEDVVLYARGLGKTQIGNKKEKVTSPDSCSLKRLSWHNSKKVGTKFPFLHYSKFEKWMKPIIRFIYERFDIINIMSRVTWYVQPHPLQKGLNFSGCYSR